MIGKTVSHHRIIEKLGQGSMGELCRAEDANLRDYVAVKILPHEFPPTLLAMNAAPITHANSLVADQPVDGAGMARSMRLRLSIRGGVKWRFHTSEVSGP
jgi:hypothetical protein